MFPTDLNPPYAAVDEAFAVMQRDLDLPEATGWVEDPTSMMHQRVFTDVSEDGPWADDPETAGCRLSK